MSKRRAQASVKRVKGDWCKTNLSEGDADKLAIQLSDAGGRMKGRGEGGGGQAPATRKQEGQSSSNKSINWDCSAP